MVYVKNETEKVITQMFDGRKYNFMPGKYVAFEDASLAKWFEAKRAKPPSPSSGRMTAEYPLRVYEAKPPRPDDAPPVSQTPDLPAAEGVDVAPSTDAEVQGVVVAPPPPAPEPAPPLSATVSHPPTPGHINPGDEQARRAADEKVLNGWPMENLIEASHKHGVFKRGADKTKIIARLLSVGFHP